MWKNKSEAKKNKEKKIISAKIEEIFGSEFQEVGSQIEKANDSILKEIAEKKQRILNNSELTKRSRTYNSNEPSLLNSENRTQKINHTEINNMKKIDYSDDSIKIDKDINAKLIKNINNTFLVSEYQLCFQECKKFLDSNTQLFSALLKIDHCANFNEFVEQVKKFNAKDLSLQNNHISSLVSFLLTLEKYSSLKEEEILNNNDILINFIDRIKQLNKYILSVAKRNQESKIRSPEITEEPNSKKIKSFKSSDLVDLIDEKVEKEIQNFKENASEAEIPRFSPKNGFSDSYVGQEPSIKNNDELIGENKESAIDLDSDLISFLSVDGFDNDEDENFEAEKSNEESCSNFPFGFYLNYFDAIRGPKSFYSVSIFPDTNIEEEILDVMNKNHGYYVLEVNQFIIYSYLFEIPSELSRGKVDILQFAVCINRNLFDNVNTGDFSQFLRKYFIKASLYFQKNKEIYLGLLHLGTDSKYDVDKRKVFQEYLKIMKITSELEAKIVGMLNSEKNSSSKIKLYENEDYQKIYLKNLSEILELIQILSKLC